MKTNIDLVRLFTVSTVILLFVSSCQKNLEENGVLPGTGTTTGGNTGGDSIYLSKYLYVDTGTGVTDSNARGTLLYDNLKRVSTIDDTSHEATSGEADNIEKISFFITVVNDAI